MGSDSRGAGCQLPPECFPQIRGVEDKWRSYVNEMTRDLPCHEPPLKAPRSRFYIAVSYGIPSFLPETEVYPEREDKMKNDLRYEFDLNDDIADIIDAVLTAPGLRIRYEKVGSRNGLRDIGDRDVEDGLDGLPDMEKKIIEKFFLQQKSLLDISKDLGIDPGLLMGHIKAIRARLVFYV